MRRGAEPGVGAAGCGKQPPHPRAHPPFPRLSQAGGCSGPLLSPSFRLQRCCDFRHEGGIRLLASLWEEAVAKVSHHGDPGQFAPPPSQAGNASPCSPGMESRFAQIVFPCSYTPEKKQEGQGNRVPVPTLNPWGRRPPSPELRLPPRDSLPLQGRTCSEAGRCASSRRSLERSP